MVPREGLRSPARRHADTHDCRNTRGHEVEGRACDPGTRARRSARSEEHTSELQSLMRISYAVFCLKKKKKPPYTLQETNRQRKHIPRTSYQKPINHILHTR